MSTTPESITETSSDDVITVATPHAPGDTPAETGADPRVATTRSEQREEDPAPQGEDADLDDTVGNDPAEEGTTRQGSTEELVREGEIAADFLEALLDIADLAGDLEVDVEGSRAAVAIVDSEDGAAPRRLVGPGGSVLDALQELTRLAVQAETGERSRLMLDVAGYRSDRRAALVKAARHAIAEVKESGAPRELEPMTAFERKVVHDEVLAAGLRSESEGAEPARYVVIQPA